MPLVATSFVINYITDAYSFFKMVLNITFLIILILCEDLFLILMFFQLWLIDKIAN